MKRTTARSSKRRPPPIRALVTDVDGTLTDARRRLDLGAVEVVRRLERSGIPVILATGNVLPIALALHRSLGLSAPIIAENGGIVYARNGSHEEILRLADRRVALRAYRHLRRRGVAVRPLFTDRWRETEVGLEATVPVNTIRRHLANWPVTVESTGYAIHLIEKGAGKLTALRRVLPRLGLSLGECLVAGDGDNDVPMLESAGWSVSFASASPGARKAADFVARARFAFGFVEALKASRVVR